MKRIAAFALVAIVIPACGGGGGGDGFVPVGTTLLIPVAVAGDDQKAAYGATVTLNGIKSYDPASVSFPTYLWEQLSGTAVTLATPTAVSTTFTAPSTPGTLSFRLTVTGVNGTDTDTIDVVVKPFVVNAPDTWWVGYGNSGTITPVVTGTTTAPTYEWTGVAAWLPVVSTTTLVLSYGPTPALTDFQNFPTRAEVAVIEKTTQGRLQLKIKVTDGLVSDEEWVNFSAGPFSDAVANENVAFGEPVFLNGGAATGITSWTWSGLKPSGANITFFSPAKGSLGTAPLQTSPTAPLLYFVPDQLGPYQITVIQNPGAIVKVIDITCGRYIGVGNLLGATPDPFVGECAACHGGQLAWLADFANPYLETGHATMYSRLLDPSNSYHAASQAKGHWRDAFNFGSSYSIDSRTVGWSAITAGTSNGWVQQATADGYVFKGMSWAELKRKHPGTAKMSNVQCESCHGPGSEHAGDTTGIRKSYDAALCGRCHSRKQDLWEVSAHGIAPSASAASSATGSASCNGCHTAQGFVVEMRAQEGANPHPVLFSGSNVNRPVIPMDDRRGTTCQACHEPHKKTANRPPQPGFDPQLRAWGNVKFRNDAVANFGEAAICAMCHTSRTDTRDASSDFNVRRAPHDSTAAEMVSSTNGMQFAGWTYNVSPHGIESAFIKPGSTENRRCLSCHADSQPAAGASGYNALGGHTFRMKQGSGTAIASNVTHTGGATVAGTKRFTVTGGATFNKSVFAGDILTLGGTPYTIQSVDHGRQVTVIAVSNFAGGSVAVWSITSVIKYNPAACTQCHTTAPDYRDVARADYDGDGSTEVVQQEIAGLETALIAAINTRLATLPGAGPGYTLTSGSGRIQCTNGTNTYTFPGPSVPTSQNPTTWASLSAADRAAWEATYKAAYNVYFVEHDWSEGIHNTGYAVNLLQSSYYAVTGTTIGAPFVPFP